MALFSWEWELTGSARSWGVAAMFCAVGLLCGLIIPFFVVPHATQESLRADGKVLRMKIDKDDGTMERPIFQYLDRDGISREFPSGILSGRSAYRVGDNVVVMYDPTQAFSAFVMGDKDLVVVLWTLSLLGIVFGGIGLAVLGMKLGGMDDDVISRIGGLIGALTYAIPATFVLPGLYVGYRLRPNGLFSVDAMFGAKEWLLGSIFTITGLITLVVTLAVYRYQARTGKAGWDWSWEWSSGKRDEEE